MEHPQINEEHSLWGGCDHLQYFDEGTSVKRQCPAWPLLSGTSSFANALAANLNQTGQSRWFRRSAKIPRNFRGRMNDCTESYSLLSFAPPFPRN